MRAVLLGLWQRLRGTPGSAVRAGVAVAIGIFVGCQPLYGLHLVLVLAVCLPLKLDAVLAYLAANISNPLLAPGLLFVEVEIGSYLLQGRFVELSEADARTLGAAGLFRQLIGGSLVLGTSLALVGFGVAWFVASRRSRPDRAQRAHLLGRAFTRTRARYESARPADRYYVAGKLAFDPVFELIAGLDGPLGRVLDLGCGRGQLALWLLDLNRASQVTGLDSDARKIEVARAAGPEADFRVADLAHFRVPPADTILLIDVLHYLPISEQDRLLEAAVEALAPRGRLVLRELDAVPSVRSRATRFFEWWGRKIGLNRGRDTGYRPASEYAAVLSRAGLSCEIQGASERTPFANVLIVAGGAPEVKNDPARSASKTRSSASNA